MQRQAYASVKLKGKGKCGKLNGLYFHTKSVRSKDRVLTQIDNKIETRITTTITIIFIFNRNVTSIMENRQL